MRTPERLLTIVDTVPHILQLAKDDKDTQELYYLLAFDPLPILIRLSSRSSPTTRRYLTHQPLFHMPKTVLPSLTPHEVSRGEGFAQVRHLLLID